MVVGECGLGVLVDLGDLLDRADDRLLEYAVEFPELGFFVAATLANDCISAGA
jgi:hypothetical protein